MVVLFVSHHVDHLVDGEVLEAQLGCADVLGHIHAGTVGAQQELLVESLLGEVGPHRTVGTAVEEAFLESLLHLLLTFEVGLAFVVYLVKRHAQCLVGLVEALIHPLVHLLPKCAHLGIALLPLHQHLVCFADEGCLLLGLFLGLLLCHTLGHVLRLEFLHLFAVMLVECHVVVTDEMVALLAARLGRLAVSPAQPGQHALADVYASVVHDIGLHHLVTVGLHDVCQGPTQKVVPHVAQMKGLVGIGAAVLYHHQGR